MYMHMYVYVYVYVCMCIYIYIHRERERAIELENKQSLNPPGHRVRCHVALDVARAEAEGALLL